MWAMLARVDALGWMPLLMAAFSAASQTHPSRRVEHVVAAEALSSRNDVSDDVIRTCPTWA